MSILILFVAFGLGALFFARKREPGFGYARFSSWDLIDLIWAAVVFVLLVWFVAYVLGVHLHS